ncbi:hypothetical protein N8651_00430 [Akkermansiaceae bacterium]|nr:hypothetical protein [Akkermansiaceae bacterium]
MKVLLIGEFSSVHNNLKRGLVNKGHEVILAANSDGFKNLGFDIAFCPYKGSSIFSAIRNIINFLSNFRTYFFNDVVQFINPLTVPFYFQKTGLLKLMFNLNKRTVYYACGTDIDFIEARSQFRYFPFDDCRHKEFPHYKNKHRIAHEYFMDRIDMVIPSMYTYSFRKRSENQSLPILLPGSFVTKKDDLKNGSQLVILFGITRRNFKGADYILCALRRIEKEFKSLVKVHIVEKIDFNDYLKELDTADILIDQCKSYDYGMNAILAMERGAIVLSGAESEALQYANMETSPVINIRPCSDQIYSEIKKLVLLSREERYKLKLKTLKHCQRYHNNEKITDKFIEIYK